VRVAAFLMSYPPERMVGAELMSAQFLEALVDAGHEVTVYADLIPAQYVRNGVHIKPRGAFEKIRKHADLIYSHPDLGTIGYIAAGLQRAPYVGVVHNIGTANSWHLVNHTPDLVVWNSESTQAHHKGEGGVVVRSPLRVKDHAAKTTGDAITLVNLIEAKGVDLFYELAATAPDDWNFLGVKGGYGFQKTPPPKKRTPPPPSKAAGTPKKNGTPTIIGPVAHDQMATKVWSKTKVLLMPSAEESWGRVGVEALCSGIPVVAHPTPGLVESLGDSGIFVDRDDTEAWQYALKELMTNDKAYAAASKKAKARAKALESITKTDLQLLVTTLEQLALTHRR
jgi:glycosyltransferase involved in cell wall biosynthesis